MSAAGLGRGPLGSAQRHNSYMKIANQFQWKLMHEYTYVIAHTMINNANGSAHEMETFIWIYFHKFI